MQIICLLLGILACILVMLTIACIIFNIIDDCKVKYLLRNGYTTCIKYVGFNDKAERIFSKGNIKLSIDDVRALSFKDIKEKYINK